MNDISTEGDVKLLIDTFYTLVLKDELIGVFFNNIIKLDFNVHLPVMYAFWSAVLLDKPGYKGNPVKKHIGLHQLKRLEESHFDRWIELWELTLDDLFKGPISNKAKERARLMKQLLLHKIESSEQRGFIA